MNIQSTTATPGNRASRRGPGRRALATGAVSLIAIGSLMAPLANAAVVTRPDGLTVAVSDEVGLGGLPLWYEDSAGNKLAPCMDSFTHCAIVPAEDLADPTRLPSENNLPGEAFYQFAESETALAGGGTLLTVISLEAAIPDTATAPPYAVFGRVRLRFLGAQPGTYTVSHPYGVDTVVVPAGGKETFSEDTGVDTPGVFTAALESRIIKNFLMPVNMVPITPVPGGSSYIADPGNTYQVTGSTVPEQMAAPSNFVQIEKAGTLAPVGFNDKFSIAGKLFDPTAPRANAGASGTAAVGSVVTLDGSTSVNATSHTWEQKSGTAVQLTTGANPAQRSFTVPNVAETLQFQLTAANDAGSTSTSLVTITPTPTAEAVTPTSPAVIGSMFDLDASTSKAAASYLWEQVGGEPVILSGATRAKESFQVRASATPLVFRLTTKNGGYSATSEIRVTPVAPVVVSTVAPVVKPSAVRSLSVAPGNGKVTVKWAAPANKGNGAFAGYTVQYRTAGAKAWAAAGTTGTSLALKVRNDVRYEFRVHARSSNGNGPVSGAVSTIASKKAHGPRAVKATPVVRGVRVTWAAPAYRGASPIRSYVVQYRTPGKAWVTAGTTTRGTFTKAGLRRGAKFEFRVLARNSFGTGYASAVVSARTK